MRESSAVRAEKANSGSARTCIRKCTPVHQILPFERWAHSVWPVKPASNLRAIMRRSLRTIRYQLSGKRKPDYDDVVALLRSEHGFSFLQHVMGDAHPPWWRGIAKVRSLATMRKQIDEQRRRIEQLELEIE